MLGAVVRAHQRHIDLGRALGIFSDRWGTSFSLETLQGLAIVGKFLRQELQGHIATQPGVLGLVDHTHSSTTKFLCDFVVGDGLTDHVNQSAPGVSGLQTS